MDVTLTPQLEELVRDKVASGYYDDANAVISEALALLDERDHAHRERLRAALAIGQEQLDRGDVIEYTPDLLETLKRRATENARKGHTVSPDVLP